jgi:predicted amidophosphoribosyltransferase
MMIAQIALTQFSLARTRQSAMTALRAFCFPAVCIACGYGMQGLCVDCAPAVTQRKVLELGEDSLTAGALGPYRGGLRKAILALKDGRRDVADALVELMAYRLGSIVPDDARLAAQAGKLLLVGIPTTPRRRLQRGVDGGHFLAQGLALHWGVPALPLLRQIAGDSQRGRGRLDRLQASGRFRVRSSKLLSDHSVLLVDDVITTGATLADVAKSMHAAGIHVVGALALAYVPLEDDAERSGREDMSWD